MNTRFLETLITLARLGSFRETADALHVTQTAVSQRIANLEDDLGTELIDRSSRFLKLTPHGQQAVEQAQKIVALTKELQRLSKQSEPVAGPVHIGAVETVVRTWLSPLIQEISQKCPMIDLEVTVDTSRNLQDLLLRKKIDLMFQDLHFMPAVDSCDYLVRNLCDYRVGWVARPDLRAGQPADAALKGISQHRILTFSKFSLPHAHLQAFLMDHGIEGAKIANFPSVESILQLLHNGYGVAAIPPIFVASALSSGMLELWDCPAPLPITIQGIMRREAPKRVHEILERSITVAHSAATRLNTDSGHEWVLPHSQA